MVLRFSVRAAQASGGSAKSEAWQVVEVPCSGEGVAIGREPGPGIELPFPAVSARHARVFRKEGAYCVEDVGSANGTMLGGLRLAAHQALPLAPGEVLDCAGVRVRFDGELPEVHPASPPEGTATLARRLVHDVFCACPPEETARLVAVSGPGAGRELALVASERALLVGRGESCDLVLPDEDVSREHAAFQRDATGISVRDLHSKNGVEVEGQELVGSRILHDGDLIRIGETTLRLVDPEDRYLRQMQEASVEHGAETTPSVKRPVGNSDVALATGVGGQRRREGRLPAFAAALAVAVLLLLAGVVLALAFGCQV